MKRLGVIDIACAVAALALVAIALVPAFAQGKREVKYVCREGVCAMSEDDFNWLVLSMRAKDEEIARLNRGCGPWRFD